MALPSYDQYLAQHAATKRSGSASGTGLLNEGRALENQLKLLELQQRAQESDPEYLTKTAVAKAQAEAAAAKAVPKTTPPAAAQQEDLYKADDTLASIATIRDLLGKGKIDTGKSQSIKGFFRNVLGDQAPLVGQNNDEQRFDALIGKLKADYTKQLSGAAVSEGEIARLSKFLPDITDSKERIATKLGVLEQETASFKKNRTGQKSAEDYKKDYGISY